MARVIAASLRTLEEEERKRRDAQADFEADTAYAIEQSEEPLAYDWGVTLHEEMNARVQVRAASATMLS